MPKDIKYNDNDLSNSLDYIVGQATNECTHFDMSYDILDQNLKGLEFILGKQNQEILSKIMESIINIEKGSLTKEEFSNLFLNEEILSKINGPVQFQYKIVIDFLIKNIK